MDRRSFLRAGALALPVVAVPGCSPTGDAAPGDTTDAPADDARAPEAARVLDAAVLGALAEVVLPSELDAEGRARAVERFRVWSDGYRPVAERIHGYGTGELRYTGPDPAPGWAAQLRALDVEARKRRGRPFAELPAAERERVVRRQLSGESNDSLPDVAAARHVALALMSHWFGSSEATDLCYGARIGRETCRPLDASGARPAARGM